MEPNSNIIYKRAMTSGLFLGIAQVAFILFVYLIGVDIIESPLWVNMVNYFIIIGGIIYGTRKFRDVELNGEISYSKALGIGVLTCVFASIIYGIYMVIHMHFIDQNYLSKLMSAMETEYYKAGISEKQIEDTMKIVGWMEKPIVMLLYSVFGLTFIGTLFSLVTSVFLKNQKSTVDNSLVKKTE
jgi:hypothetical protein